MGLTDEQIQKLLSKKSGRGGGGGPRKPKEVVRNYETWFDLPHNLVTPDRQEMSKCSNPNCQDPRHDERGQVTVNINGVEMCRFCFLGGYMAVNEEQTSLTNEN